MYFLVVGNKKLNKFRCLCFKIFQGGIESFIFEETYFFILPKY